MARSAERRGPAPSRAGEVSWLPAAVVGMMIVALVTLVAVDQVRRERLVESGDARRAAADEAVAPPALGPATGTDVPSYLDTRQAALATLEGERVAVVSLTEYRSEAEARALVGSATVLDLLVALPGQAPARAPQGVGAWVGARREAIQAERDELARLIPSVTDAGFRTEYEAEAARLDRLLGDVHPQGAVVYGVVVRAPAPILRDLAAHSLVRLVDAGGSEAVERVAGVRPEEVTRTGTPPLRPS